MSFFLVQYHLSSRKLHGLGGVRYEHEPIRGKRLDNQDCQVLATGKTQSVVLQKGNRALSDLVNTAQC